MPSSDGPGQSERDPLVERALRLLKRSARGATRKDLLSAVSVASSRWRGLRDALIDTDEVVVTGRGPGLRLVHVDHLTEAQRAEMGRDLDTCRETLRAYMRGADLVDSPTAQEVTGLNADGARRLLNELIDEGLVERTGTKRATRYLWVGPRG